MVAGSAGHITVGASTIPGEYILPPLLADFLQQHRGVSLSLKTGDSGTILAAFHEGTFPIAIVGSKPESVLHCQPLWNDELVLIAHPDIARSLPADPQISDILDCPFVMREASSGTREVFIHALKAHNMALEQCHIILEVGGNESLKAAVLHKVGIGFISRWAIQQELSDGRLCVIPVPDLMSKRQFYAVCHPPLLPTCIQLFWDFLIAQKTAVV
jgi:DNA-binding transcriptional LysR family regulator